MGQQIPADHTIASPADVYAALERTYVSELGSPPAKPMLCVCLAQWALETAEGHLMMAWSIGNAKQPTDDHDWCEYPTFEFVDGKRVDVHPPDPTCRFRAYHSLDEAVGDYLQSLWGHWTLAWNQGASKGDPVGFAQGLHDQKPSYYTAPVEQYVAGVLRYFKKYSAENDFIALPPEQAFQLGPCAIPEIDLTVDPDADTEPPGAA